MKKWIDGDELLSAVSLERKGAKTIPVSTLSQLINDRSRNQLSNDNFGFILNCAVRYALGRCTYAPSLIIEYITPIIPYLSQRTLSVMIADIGEAEDHGGYGHDSIDKPIWMQFLAALKREEERRNNEKLRKVIAVDFDGCICAKGEYPGFGEPDFGIIQRLHEEKANGAAIILWTCREGPALQAAVDACEKWGLHFDSINESIPEWVEYYGVSSRKVGASEYWDDRACVVKAHETNGGSV